MDFISLLLVIIGALNWGSIGIFGFDIVGALFGEAVVITNPAIAKDFRYMIKQRGGMLAKGRLLGIQFQFYITS